MFIVLSRFFRLYFGPIDGLNAEVQAKKPLFFLKPGKHYEHFRINLHTFINSLHERVVLREILTL